MRKYLVTICSVDRKITLTESWFTRHFFLPLKERKKYEKFTHKFIITILHSSFFFFFSTKSNGWSVFNRGVVLCKNSIYFLEGKTIVSGKGILSWLSLLQFSATIILYPFFVFHLSFFAVKVDRAIFKFTLWYKKKGCLQWFSWHSGLSGLCLFFCFSLFYLVFVIS